MGEVDGSVCLQIQREAGRIQGRRVVMNLPVATDKAIILRKFSPVASEALPYSLLILVFFLPIRVLIIDLFTALRFDSQKWYA